MPCLHACARAGDQSPGRPVTANNNVLPAVLQDENRWIMDVHAMQGCPAQACMHARVCAVQYTLPVDAHVVGDVVDDADDDEVALPREHRRPRELTVHRHDALAAAQPRHIGHLHLHYIIAATLIIRCIIANEIACSCMSVRPSACH
jgi:hypothetical protein